MEADHVQHRYGKDCRSEFRRFELSAPSARENALISADIKALPGFQGPGKANIGKKRHALSAHPNAAQFLSMPKVYRIRRPVQQPISNLFDRFQAGRADPGSTRFLADYSRGAVVVGFTSVPNSSLNASTNLLITAAISGWYPSKVVSVHS